MSYFFIIGSYLGGTIGAKTSKLLKGKTLEWILRIVILIVASSFNVESIFREVRECKPLVGRFS